MDDNLRAREYHPARSPRGSSQCRMPDRQDARVGAPEPQALGHGARLMPVGHVRATQKRLAGAVQRPAMKLSAAETAGQLDWWGCTSCANGWS
jgi:hypothetical protein